MCNADTTGYDPNRYIKREGIEEREPLNQTAFRQAERLFKSKSTCPNPVGNSLLIDFSNLSSLDSSVSQLLEQFTVAPSSKETFCIKKMNEPVIGYRIKGYDGFVHFPSLLSLQEQKEMLVESFTKDMNKPNMSNLDAVYDLPFDSLWEQYDNAAMIELKRKKTVSANLYGETEEKEQGEKMMTAEQGEKMMTAEQVFRKLRWVTIGVQYDWSTKEYMKDDKSPTFPAPLSFRSIEIAKHLLACPNYSPQAGIINYYQSKDTLTGHVDKSEENMSAPLISYSFGSACVFLLGGKTREDPVVAVMLRSGDVCVLSEQARFFFHGVPRIISEENPLLSEGEGGEQWSKVRELMKDARVNINVRQVK